MEDGTGESGVVWPEVHHASMGVRRKVEGGVIWQIGYGSGVPVRDVSVALKRQAEGPLNCCLCYACVIHSSGRSVRGALSY